MHCTSWLNLTDLVVHKLILSNKTTVYTISVRIGDCLMNRQELIERIKGFEWNDVEFKEALNACPKSAYETVSAFANTSGGWLVFGVKEQDGEFEIVGVKKVNKVETEFFSTLHQPSKISCQLDVEPSLVKDKSAVALVFFIPEACRDDKPVYLNGNIKSSYIRRGSGDHK